jgi:hypothetical protein
MEVPPISMFAQEPYNDITDFAATFRAEHPELFFVKDPETHEPVTFITRIHRWRVLPALFV